MARKVIAKFSAVIELNKDKGGAWLATVSGERPDSSMGTNPNSMEPAIGFSEITAWKNASAAKRWVKQMVSTKTPRKSVKLIGSKLDGKDKPTKFSGYITFSVPYDFEFGKK